MSTTGPAFDLATTFGVFDLMRYRMNNQYTRLGSGATASAGWKRFYRLQDGRRCPIGHLITNDVYYAEGRRRGRLIEGESVLEGDVCAAVRDSIGWLPDVALLRDCQLVHDDFPPHLWGQQFARLHKKWFGVGGVYAGEDQTCTTPT